MKIKLLFNGFRHGHILALYHKAAASELVEIAGCIETDALAREAAEKSLGIRFSEESYDQWLETDIDAVAVGNAYGDRAEVIIKALSAGKHVIADKPICTDLAQLETIRQLAQEKGLKIVGMLDLRYLPQTLEAKKILDSGRLGQVRNVSFNGQHCIDYEHRPGWYFEKGMHGGTINDLAIHGVDLVRMMTNQEIVKIDAARVWNSYARLHPDFKDSAMFMARLENGAGILADVSYSAPSQVFSMPTYWEFRFWCEKGMLTFNYVDSIVTLYEEGKLEPVTVSCAPAIRDYLHELADEIRGATEATWNILKSTETALLLQQAADKEG